MSTPTVIQSSLKLGAAPKGYKAPTFSPLSAPSTSAQVLPAGPAFISQARRVLNQRSFADEDRLLAEDAAKNGNQVVEEDDADAGLGDEQEDKQLLQLDPKLWKAQDHYAVLGLQSLRYKATDEQIKKAHRRKVLRHHPDKKASAGGLANDDSFFKCIAKAMEVLSHPEKRRQFDSVDEAIDDDVPEIKDTTDANFYDLWTPVFEREGRFSKQQPVPQLGGPEASKKEVESFYDFWYNMDSWRSFEYLDKDAPEGTDSRDEKRHQEKKNKSERDKRKKEDNQRRRELVDRALNVDPRLKAYKAAEKAARDAKKGGAKGGAAVDPKQAAADKKAAEEAAAAAKAEEERKAAEDKVARESAKKAKEAAKKNVKKDKKAITALVTANNYFAAAGSSPSPATVEAQFTELDLIFEGLEPEEIGELKKQAEGKNSPADVKAILVEFAKKAEAKVGAGKFKEFA